MLKIITDVDGVLLDWFPAFENWIIEVKDIKPLHDTTPSTYKLTDKYPLTSKEIVDYIAEFNTSSAFGELKAIDGAVEYLGMLLQDNSKDISWLSSGSVEGHEEECFDMRSKNLRNCFGKDIPGTLLVMRASKEEYLKKYKEEFNEDLIFIEDSLEHAEVAIKLGIKTILLGYSYNGTNKSSKLLYKAKNWKEVYLQVNKIEKEIEYMNTHVSRTGLSAKRWSYLKNLNATNPTYKHVSAEVSMVPNPLGKMLNPIPMVTRPGTTYNVGRNKAKREKKTERRNKV